jgi:Icc-related predicted phosphoesterase
MALRFVCISDTHNRHRELRPLPPGDVLIHSGDFTNFGKEDEVREFYEWFSEQSFKYKILIAGNHEITFDLDFDRQEARDRFHDGQWLDFKKIKEIITNDASIIYLENEAVEIEGIKIWGSPHQPAFWGWAFNIPRGVGCRLMAEKIPTDTDILITHGPPARQRDLTEYGTRVGCEDTLRVIENRVKPIVHVFGHIHNSWGVSHNEKTHFVNASSCSYDDEFLNHHIIFDITTDKQLVIEEITN